jgi:hypothetical protein
MEIRNNTKTPNPKYKNQDMDFISLVRRDDERIIDDVFLAYSVWMEILRVLRILIHFALKAQVFRLRDSRMCIIFYLEISRNNS